MAGGRGTRLRPLTSELPKPLVPLLGKPIIHYILELIKKNKVDDAVISLGFLGTQIEEELSGISDDFINLDFASEDSPLGTAGGVKNAMGNFEGDILVISGDAMCDFNLEKAIEFHRQSESMATIITKQVDDPREYGLVSSDNLGKITGFVEKPSYKSCSTDLASTGIYIISSKVLDMVKANTQTDFAQDIFPSMLKQGFPLFAFEDKGYWCDVGDIKSYIQCQRDMLDKKVDCIINNKPIQSFKGVDIAQPVYIGEGVTIGENTVIEKYSVIGDNVTIGNSCNISGVVLDKGVKIADNANLVDMIACVGATLEDNAAVYEGCVIGSEAIIRKGAIIESGVKVWNNKTVGENIKLKEDLQFGFAKDIIVEDEGIVGQTNVTITPALCTKIGSGIASLKKNTIIGVGYSNHPSSVSLYHAVVSGILASGENVWAFGECLENQFKFCLNKSQLEFGVFIDGGIVSTIKVYEKGAMSTSRPIERKLEGAINRGEYKRVGANQMGSVSNMKSMRELYEFELLKLCDASLDGLIINVKSPNKAIKQLMENVLTRLGCSIGNGNNGITVNISASGDSVCLSDNGCEYLFFERALSLVCLSEFLKGEDVSVSQTAPLLIDKLAQVHGRQVYRYFDCPNAQEDKIARQKAMSKPFLRDGLMMTIKIFSFMKTQGIDYMDMLKLIPECSVSSRLVSISVSPSVIMKKLKCDKEIQSEGVVASKGGKRAYVRPLKTGKGIMIYAESVNSETSAEICDMFEEVIKDSMLDK